MSSIVALTLRWSFSAANVTIHIPAELPMPVLRRSHLFASVVIPIVLLASRAPARPTIIVAPVVLNNMSALPDTHADSVTVVLLTREARARLASCGYPAPADSAPSITAEHPGASYLWEHADEVAKWGAAQHADWVLVSRFNRIGPWVAEWETQVVSTHLQRSVDTRVVELKGIGRDTSLTTHLSNRGAAWLVDQVTQSVAHTTGDTTAAGRPCHA
jgi:hypothetical protein